MCLCECSSSRLVHFLELQHLSKIKKRPNRIVKYIKLEIPKQIVTSRNDAAASVKADQITASVLSVGKSHDLI